MDKEPLEDGALMARLCQGDEGALEALICRHRPGALALARRMLGDEDEAEEAVLDAFARAYLLRERYRPEFAFASWLNVLVRSLCLDRLRRRARRPVPLPWVDARACAPSPEAIALAREERLQLWRALDSLSEPEKQLLLGYALEGRSYQELAQAHRLTLSQVRLRLHRIRKRLRRKEETQL